MTFIIQDLPLYRQKLYDTTQMRTSQEMTLRLKIQKLEYVLDILCQEADRPITVFLPEKYEDQVSYLKMEIQKTVEML